MPYIQPHFKFSLLHSVFCFPAKFRWPWLSHDFPLRVILGRALFLDPSLSRNLSSDFKYQCLHLSKNGLYSVSYDASIQEFKRYQFIATIYYFLWRVGYRSLLRPILLNVDSLAIYLSFCNPSNSLSILLFPIPPVSIRLCMLSFLVMTP